MIINANALKIPLASKSVQTVVTSPPYWNQRDYGTAIWKGGDPECDHSYKDVRNDAGRYQTDGFHGSNSTDSNKGKFQYKDVCEKCGAVRVDDQLGLEKTPQEFVANMLRVFDEVGRILKDDGILWINMGDGYCSKPSGKPSQDYIVNQTKGDGAFRRRTLNFKGGDLDAPDPKPATVKDMGLIKEKDLIGMPWTLAMALRDHGWYLRRDVIWFKTNPIPEPARDRPSTSHEYIFMLTKQKRYYFDLEAVKVPYTKPIDRWGGTKLVPNGVSPRDIEVGSELYRDRNMRPDENGRMPRSVWYAEEDEYRQFLEWKKTMVEFADVWTIPAKASGYKHYAQFPAALTTPCILASTKEGDVVFDPFVGSGTTILEAERLGRHGIGTDLSLDYLRNIAQLKTWRKQKQDWKEAKPKVVQDDYSDLSLFGGNHGQG